MGRLKGDQLPVCLELCTNGALRFGEFEENRAENIFKISDYLLVKTSSKWQGRGEEVPVKRRLPAQEA
jgi:Fe-S-cluster-containing dehydrogenase component